GIDEFRTIDDAAGAGGNRPAVGGSDACCDDGGSGGNTNSLLGSGGSVASACELSTIYCAVDWVGSWDKPGFAEGAGASARFSQLAGIAVVEDTIYVTHGHAVSAIDLES